MSAQAEELDEVQTPFPMFEGKEVKGLSVKITQMASMKAPDMPVFGVDDRLRVVGAFKCIGIRHYVDKNGDLMREQILVPIELEPCPWDPSDPNDDGVVRARP